jgi:hypothetical protein
MKKEDLNKYFEILELETNANFEDVKSAYHHLKTLYSSDSPLFASISETFDKQERIDLLKEIEEAFAKLKDYFETSQKKKKDTTQTRVRNQNIPEFEKYSGDALRLTREVLGIGLEEVAFNTGIALKHLQNIEAENYKELPPKIYIKAMIKKYAESLYLNTDKVVNDYVDRMEKKKSKKFRFPWDKNRY